MLIVQSYLTTHKGPIGVLGSIYADKTAAIHLVNVNTRENVRQATVHWPGIWHHGENMAGYPIAPRMCFVKEAADCEGVWQTLTAAEVVTPHLAVVKMPGIIAARIISLEILNEIEKAREVRDNNIY